MEAEERHFHVNANRELDTWGRPGNEAIWVQLTQHFAVTLLSVTLISGSGYRSYKVLPNALHAFVDCLELTSAQGIFKVEASEVAEFLRDPITMCMCGT